MGRLLQVHPENPQGRFVAEICDCLRGGGVVIYPTDSSYALGCRIGDKAALDRIRRIRQLGEDHNFTLVCRSLSEVSQYTKMGNQAHRWIRHLTPGPYTFILRATKDVPRRLMHRKRKTIGIRIPDNRIAQAIAEQLNEPIMSTTLIVPGEEMPMTDPYDMLDTLGHAVDLVVDGGHCGFEPTTVVSLEDDSPVVVRTGVGDATLFLTDEAI